MASSTHLATVILACLCLCTVSVSANVRYNQVQMISAHNSYHVAPRPALVALIRQLLPGAEGAQLAAAAEYTMPPLPDLLSKAGVRSIELDTYADSEGLKWAFRTPLLLFGLDPYDRDPAMLAPGFKVLHLDNIDFETTCKTMAACLEALRAWSDSHPQHLPITIKLEIKTDALRDNFEPAQLENVNDVIAGNTPADADPPWPTTLPAAEPLDANTITALMEEVVTALGGESRIVTPAEVLAGAGANATLRAALTGDTPSGAWPLIDDMRGRFVLVSTGPRSALQAAYGPDLADSPVFSRLYVEQPPALADIPDDVVFVELDSVSTAPAFGEAVAALVRSGFIVHARADKDTVEARSGDTAPFELLLASGCHHIMTDFPVAPTLFQGTYAPRLQNGQAMRCNSVSAPEGCSDEDVGEPFDEMEDPVAATPPPAAATSPPPASAPAAGGADVAPPVEAAGEPSAAATVRGAVVAVAAAAIVTLMVV